MWFELKGDERINERCATEGCGGQPTYRLEAGGVGSNYCSGCRALIVDDATRLHESNHQLAVDLGVVRIADAEAVQTILVAAVQRHDMSEIEIAEQQNAKLHDELEVASARISNLETQVDALKD